MVTTLRFGAFLSEHESTMPAVGQIVSAAREAGTGEIDAAFVFFTAHHRDDAQALVEQLWLELDPQSIIGCSAEGVIGGDREVERAPGIAVLCAQMPGVRIHPFHITTDDWQRLLSDPEALVERVGYGEETRAVIGFGDPWTTPLTEMMGAMDQHMPGAPLIGGMASAARNAGENLIVRNDETYSEGLVGVSLSGAIDVQTVVSQGCRPIGQTYVITKAHDNVIEQLGGRAALEALRDVLHSLPPGDSELLRHGLLIGRAISEYRESFGRGDFLVRNIMGVNQQSGAIAMADYVRVGQTIQFHVRDAASADEDLRLMLQPQKENPPAGGLLISCNGRGRRLFDQPHHDISVARDVSAGTAFAGFFAAGEIGPVGGRNFIHGHTASLAMFRARE
jgi:small ligand-binding sensory domain FIST